MIVVNPLSEVEDDVGPLPADTGKAVTVTPEATAPSYDRITPDSTPVEPGGNTGG
jgi:hypothetical protein